MPLSGPWEICKEGKVPLLCGWLVKNCWVGDEGAKKAPRSVQVVSDLKFLDQTISRLRSEFGFVRGGGDLDDDKGSK